MNNKDMFRKALLIVCSIPCLLLAGEIEEQLKKVAQDSYWETAVQRPVITRSNLIQAIEMARAYYLNHQNPDGNFIRTR